MPPPSPNPTMAMSTTPTHLAMVRVSPFSRDILSSSPSTLNVIILSLSASQDCLMTVVRKQLFQVPSGCGAIDMSQASFVISRYGEIENEEEVATCCHHTGIVRDDRDH